MSEYKYRHYCKCQNINTDITASTVCAANVCAVRAANLSNILMCVLLHLLICTALGAHINVVEALYIEYIITITGGFTISLRSDTTFNFDVQLLNIN